MTALEQIQSEDAAKLARPRRMSGEWAMLGRAAFREGKTLRNAPRNEHRKEWKDGWRYQQVHDLNEKNWQRAIPLLRQIDLDEHAEDLMVWMHPVSGEYDINPCTMNFTGNGQACYGTVAEVRRTIRE